MSELIPTFTIGPDYAVAQLRRLRAIQHDLATRHVPRSHALEWLADVSRMAYEMTVPYDRFMSLCGAIASTELVEELNKTILALACGLSGVPVPTKE